MGLLKRYLRMELRHPPRQQHPLPGHRAHGRPAARRAGRAAARAWSSTRGLHRACSSTSRSTTAAGPRSPTPCAGWSRTRSARAPIPRASTSALIASYIYTAGQPDPDLLIRTSGEMRISQLPALADRLRGDLGHRRVVARLPPPAPAAGDRRLPEARAALRRDRPVAGEPLRPGFAADLARRVGTAAIALPLLRPAPVQGAAAGHRRAGRRRRAPSASWELFAHAAPRAASRRCARVGRRAAPPSSSWPSRSPALVPAPRCCPRRRASWSPRPPSRAREDMPTSRARRRRAPCSRAAYLGALGGTHRRPARPRRPRPTARGA